MTNTQPTTAQLDKISYFARKIVTISLLFAAIYLSLNTQPTYGIFAAILFLISLFSDTRGLYSELKEDKKLFDKN